jgi:hypothetical protein
MIDPISVGLTAAIFAAGWVAGRRSRRKAGPKSPPLPWCMCQHHYGAHDPQTGRCTSQHTERLQERPGGSYGDVWVDCSCRRYVGPQPVEQYWVPPAADMSIVTAPLPPQFGIEQH